MSETRFIGMAKSVREWEVAALTEAEQDEFITLVAQVMEQEFRAFVGDARPLGDMVFQVSGPHDDPLQGRIHVHTLAGRFRLKDLPDACEAYRVYVQGNQPDWTPDYTTDGSDQ